MQRGATSFALIAGIAGLGGLLFGYGTAIVAGALLFLRHVFSLDASSAGLFVAIALAAAALGAALAGVLADRFGRRRIIALAALLFAVGSLLAALANSIPLLFLGRACLGLGIGLSSTVTPLYLAEITPAKQRGAIVTINQLLITVGILIAYLISLAFADSSAGWRWMFALGALPAIVLLLGVLLLPESPRWLLQMGRSEAARQALQGLRLDPAATQWQELAANNPGQRSLPWRALLAQRRPLQIALVLAIFQQITGINVVLYFAPIIFHAAGFTSTDGEIIATVGIGTINFFATLLALRWLDRIGRRPLLLTSFLGMFASLLTLASCMLAQAQGAFLYLLAFAVAAYVAFFAIGIGPVFWLLISEIFPTGLRGRAMGLATIVNWLSNMLVTGVFLSLMHWLGEGQTFFLYALASLVAAWYTWRRVPETRGLTLEEISASFARDDSRAHQE
ncbi:sugar porter family MFS transporter [Acidithiobacillus sp. CV18-2]|uniref:Sugar porter family MFS transporter n=1 Tax=Igneacidithiobacillus copahuensis TaxID=2724909 RepID=A0AAE2YNP0_9PROT|nr:sugar porter family MFS transporter [Igneacidithiobacillus copahuensis]MBU2754580.1 sugar porter family MFS transporter [Acidithiobacillus sp. CV18-3]MBU2757258.1 sugar porter family MFS transporter [Acidithiobacillus sp. BN09-2]MBU2776827.1 sugar porter family MFS transporter [Acidithiobacillus sp. CV18-2]MBU2796425.1 sugar porter family MFS transporter [Acidithiobacillus sp. VAN18-2]MBU2799443.1 sugar porter family MFS transporter [Acidithiobacillus sp. VAN18-4]UTV81047.1 sugar porter fa